MRLLVGRMGFNFQEGTLIYLLNKKPRKALFIKKKRQEFDGDHSSLANVKDKNAHTSY
jgi:hypothetical protein